jgi:hypothetical protein
MYIVFWSVTRFGLFNPLNAELNPIRHLLTLVGTHHFVDVSRIRVNKHQDFGEKLLSPSTGKNEVSCSTQITSALISFEI